MSSKVLLGLLVVAVIGVTSAEAQTAVQGPDGMWYVNGEPFNGYRTDHADAYMATIKPEVHFQSLTPKPSKLTTMAFVDVRQSNFSRSYLVLWDDVASWPVLVRIVPEDLSKPEMQFQVSIPKGRRVTVDFSVYPELRGTNFAVIVTMAEDQNSATLTTYIGDIPYRQQPDIRIREVK